MRDGSIAFAAFMASTAGRLLRIMAGMIIIGWGWSTHETTAGVVAIIVGLLPLLAGLFNVCLIAPLIGAPFAGKDARRTSGGFAQRR